MINITFLILCVIRGFFIQIPFSYYDKSRILIHTALNLEIPKSLYLNAYYKKICILLILKFILGCLTFWRTGKGWRGCYIGYRNK